MDFPQERDIPLLEQEGRENMRKSQICAIMDHYRWIAQVPNVWIESDNFIRDWKVELN